LAAYLILGRGDVLDSPGRLGAGLALVSLTLGVVAYELAPSSAADAMLALFMGSIVVVWAVKLLDHAGVLPLAEHSPSPAVAPTVPRVRDVVP
ncbi:MAG: hypothetical protein ABIO16_00995, partial [Nocardioides sp.]